MLIEASVTSRIPSMTAEQENVDHKDKDKELNVREEEELIARLRRSGVSLPREPEEIDLWAERTRGNAPEPAFAAQAVDAVLRGLDTGRIRIARDHVLAGQQLPWGELVHEIRSTAGLSIQRIAGRLDVSEKELTSIEHGERNPFDVSVRLLARLADLFELKVGVLVEAIRRFFPASGSASGRSRAVGVRPLLAGGAAGPGETLSSRLAEIEASLRQELVDRDRRDLLD